MTGYKKIAVLTAAVLAPCLPGAQLLKQELPGPTRDSLMAALESYEVIRAELATDQLEGLPVSAGRLADAFREALEGRAGFAEGVAGVIEAAAIRSRALAKAEDLARARAEFGEVSRQVLLLASVDPRLAEGLHVFACPMVKTFSKWIQPDEGLDNPYMGKAMPACGFSTDWSTPEVEEKAAPGPPVSSSTEPEFTPGIPGVKMVDVRDYKFLWVEIEQLQGWERGDRISIAEYRSKVIEKTAHFLGFVGSEAETFAGTARQSVAGARNAFFEMLQTGQNPADIDTQFSSALRDGVVRVASLLTVAPRHQLFAPDCKKWLLKLAFGPRENKETTHNPHAEASTRTILR